MQDWFLPMTFHVAGFLLLPFLLPPRRLSRTMAVDHAVRYLVPFGFALLAYAAAFRILVASHTGTLAWICSIPVSFFIASPDVLVESTGFYVLWFLPTLLSLVILRSAFHSGTGLRRAVIAMAAVTTEARRKSSKRLCRRAS